MNTSKRWRKKINSVDLKLFKSSKSSTIGEGIGLFGEIQIAINVIWGMMINIEIFFSVF